METKKQEGGGRKADLSCVGRGRRRGRERVVRRRGKGNYRAAGSKGAPPPHKLS